MTLNKVFGIYEILVGFYWIEIAMMMRDGMAISNFDLISISIHSVVVILGIVYLNR
jgi:hypothetical protein